MWKIKTLGRKPLLLWKNTRDNKIECRGKEKIVNLDIRFFFWTKYMLYDGWTWKNKSWGGKVDYILVTCNNYSWVLWPRMLLFWLLCKLKGGEYIPSPSMAAFWPGMQVYSSHGSIKHIVSCCLDGKGFLSFCLYLF